jgi:starch phosphorylase
MKVLVNGGLNLSTLDGWWEEAYAPGLGWAIGNRQFAAEAEQDRHDAEELYTLLEHDVVPAFYDRDAGGIPRAWVTMMARSMTELTLRYGAVRMVREYLDRAYLPAAAALSERIADGASAARAMVAWDRQLRRAWPGVHIGEAAFTRQDSGWDVSVPIYLGEVATHDIRVEIYAEPIGDGAAEKIALTSDGPVPGATGSYFYFGKIGGTRPAGDYTVRVVPARPGVRVPTETALIRWQR